MITPRYLGAEDGLAHLWVYHRGAPHRSAQYACGLERPKYERQARHDDRTPICAACWVMLESRRAEGRK